VGSRTLREFTPADLNLLAAAGTQFAAAIEKSLLYEEARQAYENVRRTQEQLLQSEKMAAVGQLISGVAHELNNPLTAILGYSQLLASSCEISVRGGEYLEKLHKQAQRTQRIVQNLLSFARQQKPERLPVNLNQILDDTLALREYDLRINNIQIHRELTPNLPFTAADPHQLQQVFLNILNNAVDAVLEKGHRGEIWIRSAMEGRNLVVEFTDSGSGVVDPSRVFDPFYTTKPVGKGTGLGLSICYGIVTEHGGTVQVRNAPPRGATFVVKLPLHSGASPLRSSVAGTRGMVSGRVLVVDDEEEIVDVEREILLARGFSIVVAHSGRQAQQCLEKETVDLVVTDVKMPGEMSGRDLYEWILKHRPELAGRVVFTMSSGRSEEMNTLLQKSGCCVVQKPFEVETFAQAVQQILQQTGAPTVRP
jgi:two-component system NtrC family sensor kinase